MSDEGAEDRKRRLEPGHGTASLLDRLEVVGQPEQAQRLERAAFDAKRVQDLLEVGRRAQRKARMVGEEARAFARRLLRGDHLRVVGERVQLGQPVASRRCDRQPGDCLDDTIEFESPEGARVHAKVQVGRFERKQLRSVADRGIGDRGLGFGSGLMDLVEPRSQTH